MRASSRLWRSCMPPWRGACWGRDGLACAFPPASSIRYRIRKYRDTDKSNAVGLLDMAALRSSRVGTHLLACSCRRCKIDLLTTEHTSSRCPPVSCDAVNRSSARRGVSSFGQSTSNEYESNGDEQPMLDDDEEMVEALDKASKSLEKDSEPMYYELEESRPDASRSSTKQMD